MTAAEDHLEDGFFSDDDERMEGPSTNPFRGLVWTVGVLVVWTILAIRNPTLTYHFAPLIAAAAWPIASRREAAQPLMQALISGVGALVLVTVVSLALWSSENLDGPILWGDGPAVVEALLFAALGALFGTWVAGRKRAGLLGSIFSK